MEDIDYSEYLFDEFVQSVAGLSDSDNPLANELNGNNNNVYNSNKYNGEYSNKCIFFTLNSYREVGQFEYRAAIRYVLEKTKKKFSFVPVVQWYYEDKDSRGNPCRLHVHGMMSYVPERFYPYEGMLKFIAKEFHKIIGKPRLRHSICCDIQWARSNDAVSRYCAKQLSTIGFMKNSLVLN